MKIGFVFSGQGTQTVGMGKDLYEKYEEIKTVYKSASNILDIDIANLTFNTTEEELIQTKNTQIAILVMCLGILEILKKNKIEAEFVAGLSLGEYTALAYSEAIGFEDVIKIVRKRGELMQDLAPKGKWNMVAILGLEDKLVEEICKRIGTGFAVPANYNYPGQVVISGDKLGIKQAIEIAKTSGAKRVIELKAGGPFHTIKMLEASNTLRKELENINILNPKCMVIKNIDAKEYSEKDNIKEILANHVINPVRFSESIKYMINNGVDTIIEIGPGKVLTGFIKKINNKVNTLNINNVESLENVINLICR